MWKSLNPGDSVTIGDIIRHISSHAISAFGERAWQVVKSDLHYFVIAPRKEEAPEENPEKHIIRYSDIGYHLGVEVWLDQMANAV